MGGRGSELRAGAQGILPFEIEEVEGISRVTSYAGLPLLAETFRASGAAEAVRRWVRTRRRRRDRGLSDVELVESFVLMLAAGGECNDDFNQLRSDAALAETLGHALPSPSRAKQFLYAFHDDERDEGVEEQRRLFPSLVREENASLAGLHEALRATAAAAQAHQEEFRATIDLDATIIVSDKREAAMTYAGERGYQPVVAWWAEKELIVADEFRDGNVPAGSEPLRCLQKAVATLPGGIERLYVRADSAAYEHEFLNWCREDTCGHAPIIFAVSADMSVQLRRAITALPEKAWRFMDAKGDRVRSWAEVEFIPSGPSVKKGRAPDRYLAIRIRPQQGELFADGSHVKHFAIVTNDWGRDGDAIIEWHRGKAGTVEKLHDVMKNDLGAGVMPCGRFGANAAWFRLNALTHNLLSILRRTALPRWLSKARPKRLRFHVLCVAGEVIHHARKLTIRVFGDFFGGRGLFIGARRKLRQLLRCVLAHSPPLLASA